MLGKDLAQDIKKNLTKFLKNRKLTFAWHHEDMTNISKDVIKHKLNVDPSYRQNHQKKEENLHLKGT